jgi:trimeric autotransporter adhesin
VLITDLSHGVVRELSPQTDGMRVLAGDGTSGYSGDGGPATSAEVSFPGAVAVDAVGNLVIADTGNSVVRVVAVRTGWFYGQEMTSGDIYTVAGTGTEGYSGEGSPATAVELAFPYAVAVGNFGNLLIADSQNNRIRLVVFQPR